MHMYAYVYIYIYIYTYMYIYVTYIRTRSSGQHHVMTSHGYPILLPPKSLSKILMTLHCFYSLAIPL